MRNRKAKKLLRDASKNGDDQKIDILINSISDPYKQLKYVNSKDSFGRTPLYHALKRGNIEASEVLLKNGANLNCRVINRQKYFVIMAARLLAGAAAYKLSFETLLSGATSVGMATGAVTGLAAGVATAPLGIGMIIAPLGTLTGTALGMASGYGLGTIGGVASFVAANMVINKISRKVLGEEIELSDMIHKQNTEVRTSPTNAHQQSFSRIMRNDRNGINNWHIVSKPNANIGAFEANLANDKNSADGQYKSEGNIMVG